MIISRTPFRISFFGGGTDYPAWYRENGGSVLGTAIDKYCYISCRHLPPFFEHRFRIVYSKSEIVREVAEIVHPSVRAVLQSHGCTAGLEVHHDGDLPARSGLGSSSSFTVGLINALVALDGKRISKRALADRAIEIEQGVIREHVGSQDQIFASFGGFNRVDFHRDGSYDVTPVVLPPERVAALLKHLMLFFTGLSRDAPGIAKSQIDNFANRRDELLRMRALVDEALAVLEDDMVPIATFGELLHQNWLFKRSLSDKVSSQYIDSIYDTGRAAGAVGGKLLGAGGGGFMLFVVPPGERDAVRARLGNLIHVPFGFDTAGSRIVLYEPNGLS